MPRFETHISRLLILCVALCLLNVRGIAQDSSTLQIVPPNAASQNDSVIRFDEVRQGSQISEHLLPDSTVKRLKKDDAFWYVNTNPRRAKQDAQRSPGHWNAAWLGRLFWFLVIAAFIVIAVLFIMGSNIRLFRKKAAKVHADAPTAPEENIFSVDFEEAIRKAAGQRAYTMAVRLGYLQVLKILSERQLIDYAVQKTNSIYLAQLAGSPYYKGFAELTRKFEKVWYGRFPVDEDTYRGIEKDFTQFKTNLTG